MAAEEVPQLAFDFNGDGTLEQSSWVSPDDAFLVHDANNDEIVNDGSEIVFADLHPDAATDLEGLRLVFDSNEDGVLDANDDLFSEFGIWQDANSDGVTDAGEYSFHQSHQRRDQLSGGRRRSRRSRRIELSACRWL